MNRIYRMCLWYICKEGSSNCRLTLKANLQYIVQSNLKYIHILTMKKIAAMFLTEGKFDGKGIHFSKMWDGGSVLSALFCNFGYMSNMLCNTHCNILCNILQTNISNIFAEVCQIIPACHSLQQSKELDRIQSHDLRKNFQYLAKFCNTPTCKLFCELKQHVANVSLS